MLDIKERENQKRMINHRMTENEAKELQVNMQQTKEVLNKEQKLVTDRRMDRQRADYLSKCNQQQQRQRKLPLDLPSL